VVHLFGSVIEHETTTFAIHSYTFFFRDCLVSLLQIISQIADLDNITGKTKEIPR
jgi:hypothetical protein